ncbi:DUF2293 domain-containing protein [Pseudonocardia sichuanensis]
MPSIEQRVGAAAEAALAGSTSVSPLDVLGVLGWVTLNHEDRWRQGRAGFLEPLEAVRPEKLAAVLDALRRWAEGRGLQPSEAAYVSATRDRRPLRFLRAAGEDVERALRTHWISPDLSERQRERVVERQNRAPDLLVIEPITDWTCTSCGGTGGFLFMEDAGPLCLTCTDLDHLEFLPAGDAALTRRAKKASGLSAVVVRWNRSRKRYQRQGILVEEAALQQAEQSCLADEDARLRRRERDRERRAAQDEQLAADMAAQIRRLFPGCPPQRAAAIAAHTAVRGSGRVGRSAPGRALDERALTNAVVASVRHEDTPYDELLMSGVPREDARERIRTRVDAVLDRWR